MRPEVPRHASTRARRRSSRARSIRARARSIRASRGMASTVERVGRARAPVRKTILTHPDDDADALALGCAVHGASRRV
jgi:hypothetical protein